jgi:hypothetical protein
MKAARDSTSGGTGSRQVIGGSLTLTSTSRIQAVTLDVYGAVSGLQDAKAGPTPTM